MAITFEGDSAPLAGCLARLDAVGYQEAGVAARLGLDDLAGLQMRALPIYRAERLAERDALATAIDLFLLQGQASVPELDALFGPEDQAALVRAGVLAREGGGFRARASLYPVGPRLVFSDHAWPQLEQEGFSAVPHDQVMYVGTDSRWLARVTRREPVAEALDLCCGSGIHALLAAAHAGLATAVDINPKAVRCTAFNARAWGLGNLEALAGDLYGPVGDRRFGLITANPPFVPAPAQEVGFRDGGPSGEDVQARIVAGLPRHLAPGGSAQIVTEFGEGEGESIEQRLRRWLDGAPMAIHILRLRVVPAQAYAIGHADGDRPADFLASVGSWAANLGAQGYRQVVSVLLAFEWSPDPWTRVDEAQAPVREAGPELAACLQAERLARDPALPERLRSGRVARIGPVALLEGRALGGGGPGHRPGPAGRPGHARGPLPGAHGTGPPLVPGPAGGHPRPPGRRGPGRAAAGRRPGGADRPGAHGPGPAAALMWHLYLLQCGPVIYTGITTDVAARVAAHAAGKGARFTRGRAGQQLIFQAPAGTRGEALKLERAVKRLSHQDKLALAAGRRALP